MKKKTIIWVSISIFMITSILFLKYWDEISLQKECSKIIEIEREDKEIERHSGRFPYFNKIYIISDAPDDLDSLLKLLEKFVRYKPLESYVEDSLWPTSAEIRFEFYFYEENEWIKNFRDENGKYQPREIVRDQLGDQIGSIYYSTSNNKLEFNVMKRNEDESVIETITKLKNPVKLKGFRYDQTSIP